MPEEEIKNEIDLTVLEGIRNRMVEKINKNTQLYDYTTNLTGVDVDNLEKINAEVNKNLCVEAVMDEFLRKVETEKNSKVFIPDVNKNLLNMMNVKSFDIRRMLKYRQDSIRCKRLRIQLKEMHEIVKKEYATINAYMEKLKKYEKTEEVSNEEDTIVSEVTEKVSEVSKVSEKVSEVSKVSENVSESNISQEESSILEKIEEELALKKITVRHKLLDLSSKEVNCILGLIKTKKKNLRLLLEVQKNMVAVIKEGEGLKEFVDETLSFNQIEE